MSRPGGGVERTNRNDGGILFHSTEVGLSEGKTNRDFLIGTTIIAKQQ